MPCAVQGTPGQVLGPKHRRGSWLPAFMVTLGPGAQDTGRPPVAEATHDSQEAVQTACHGPDSVPRFTRRGHNPQGLRA